MTVLENLALLFSLTLAGGVSAIAHQIAQSFFEERKLKLQIELSKARKDEALSDKMLELQESHKATERALQVELSKLQNKLGLF